MLGLGNVTCEFGGGGGCRAWDSGMDKGSLEEVCFLPARDAERVVREWQYR